MTASEVIDKIFKLVQAGMHLEDDTLGLNAYQVKKLILKEIERTAKDAQ